jgi:Probable cobalt transporter subunit (CbtB)
VKIQNGRATVDSQTRLPSSTLKLGRDIPKGNDMTSSEARKSVAPAVDLSLAKAALWLTLTAFLALVVLYFVGLDQGATSVFGDNMYVHEFVHDARHLLGFPCH